MPPKEKLGEAGSWREAVHTLRSKLCQDRCAEPRALSFQPKLLRGQIPAPLKEFCAFVPAVPSPALRGSRSVLRRGPGTSSDWQRSVRGGTTCPCVALGPDAQTAHSLTRARIHTQSQTPGRTANLATPAEAKPRGKNRFAEDPRKAEGARSLPRERQM